MKIICLCGDTNLKLAFKEAERLEELKGNIVLKKTSLLNENESNKTELKKMQLEKIKKADQILVLNVNNHIDEETEFEIEYAKSLKKEIIYLEKKEEIEENIESKIEEEPKAEKIEHEIKEEATEANIETKIIEEKKINTELNFNITEKKESNFFKKLLKFIIKLSIFAGIIFGLYIWITQYNGKEFLINKINLFLEEKQVKNPGLNNNTSKNKSKLEHIMLVKNYNKSILEKEDLKTKEIETKIRENEEKKSISNFNLEQVDMLRKTVSIDILKKYLIDVNKEIESIMGSQLNDESILNNYNETNLKTIYEKYTKK